MLRFLPLIVPLGAALALAQVSRSDGQASLQTRPAERPRAAEVNLYGDDRIRLVIRADDFGFSHASNMALKRILEEGTLTAASVIVNTGWLDEAVEILKEHPEVRVGVDVCLSSERTPDRVAAVLPAEEEPA